MTEDDKNVVRLALFWAVGTADRDRYMAEIEAQEKALRDADRVLRRLTGMLKQAITTEVVHGNPDPNWIEHYVRIDCNNSAEVHALSDLLVTLRDKYNDRENPKGR